MSCFVIAEAGVNHNGDIHLAKELIHAAKEIGADAVKFQTFKADSLVNKTAETAEYQQKNTQQTSQYAMLKALELSIDDHLVLAELASSLGIEFMSTGFDTDSIDFLISLGVKRLKVPSGEVTNIPYLKHLAATRMPLIISTGMCDLADVQLAIDTIAPYYGKDLARNIVILHCTSNYPAAFEDINLLAMQTMAREFHLPVGYSDHSLGSLVPIMAVAMGAEVIEKHFTLDVKLPGPDHAASMMPLPFKKLIESIRDAEKVLGNGIKQARDSELPVRDLVRRSVSLKHDLPKGTRLTKDDLILLRPGFGIKPVEIEAVLGSVLNVSLSAGAPLLWEHIEVQ